MIINNNTNFNIIMIIIIDNNNEQFLYSAILNINELNAHVTPHSQTYTHEQKMTKRHNYMYIMIIMNERMKHFVIDG